MSAVNTRTLAFCQDGELSHMDMHLGLVFHHRRLCNTPFMGLACKRVCLPKLFSQVSLVFFFLDSLNRTAEIVERIPIFNVYDTYHGVLSSGLTS